MSAYDEYMSQYQNATSDEDAWNIGGWFGVDAGHTQRLDFLSQQAANAFSAEQAQLQRDWQENMANTAYQRQVHDMRKAGLNPYLSYGQGGSATPSGSSASASSGHSSTGGGGRAVDLISTVGNLILRAYGQGKSTALEVATDSTDRYQRRKIGF